jgi:hypothetical protein
VAVEAVAVGAVAVVAVAAERIPDAKKTFPAVGKLEASRLFVALPHTAVEPAVDDVAGGARNLDIVVLAQKRPAEALALEDPAYAGVGRVDVVACWGHYVDCR